MKKSNNCFEQQESVILKSKTIPNRTYQCFIDHEGDEKYILCKCEPLVTIDSNGKPINDGLLDDRWVFASTDSETYHSGQLRWLVENTKTILKNFCRPECLGGGIITVNHKDKTIKTYGQSYAYGKPDIAIVREVIQLFFGDKGYTIDVTVTDEIRG
eukprot:gene2354-2905_t